MRADNSGALQSAQSANTVSVVNGQTINAQMTYNTFATNLKDSAYALIYGDGRINGQRVNDVLAAYAGRPTLASENNLSGSATYKGKAYLADNAGILGSFFNKKADFNLTANFDTKEVSGSINWQDTDEYQLNQSINLEKTSISTENNQLFFAGTASRHQPLSETGYINYTGSYDGKFMGEGAKEVVGKTQLGVSSSRGLLGSPEIKAAFGGTKQ